MSTWEDFQLIVSNGVMEKCFLYSGTKSMVSGALLLNISI